MKPEHWERYIIRFNNLSEQENAYLVDKQYDVLLPERKNMLEMQFDENLDFQQHIYSLDKENIRDYPLGKDLHGYGYWFFYDEEASVVVYKENDIKNEWFLICKERDHVDELITSLKNDTGLNSEKDKNNDSSVALNKPSSVVDSINDKNEFNADPLSDIKKHDDISITTSKSIDDFKDIKNDNSTNNNDLPVITKDPKIQRSAKQLAMNKVLRKYTSCHNDPTKEQNEEIKNRKKSRKTLKIYCFKCLKARPLEMQTCTSCECHYHLACLPPTSTIIEAVINWICPVCEQRKLIENLSVKLKILDDLIERQKTLARKAERLKNAGINSSNIIKNENIIIKEHDIIYPRACRDRKRINYQFEEFDRLIQNAIDEQNVHAKRESLIIAKTAEADENNAEITEDIGNEQQLELPTSLDLTSNNTPNVEQGKDVNNSISLPTAITTTTVSTLMHVDPIESNLNTPKIAPAPTTITTLTTTPKAMTTSTCITNENDGDLRDLDWEYNEDGDRHVAQQANQNAKALEMAYSKSRTRTVKRPLRYSNQDFLEPQPEKFVLPADQTNVRRSNRALKPNLKYVSANLSGDEIDAADPDKFLNADNGKYLNKKRLTSYSDEQPHQITSIPHKNPIRRNSRKFSLYEGLLSSTLCIDKNYLSNKDTCRSTSRISGTHNLNTAALANTSVRADQLPHHTFKNNKKPRITKFEERTSIMAYNPFDAIQVLNSSNVGIQFQGYETENTQVNRNIGAIPASVDYDDYQRQTTLNNLRNSRLVSQNDLASISSNKFYDFSPNLLVVSPPSSSFNTNNNNQSNLIENSSSLGQLSNMSFNDPLNATPDANVHFTPNNVYLPNIKQPLTLLLLNNNTAVAVNNTSNNYYNNNDLNWSASDNLNNDKNLLYLMENQRNPQQNQLQPYLNSCGGSGLQLVVNNPSSYPTGLLPDLVLNNNNPGNNNNDISTHLTLTGRGDVLNVGGAENSQLIGAAPQFVFLNPVPPSNFNNLSSNFTNSQ